MHHRGADTWRSNRSWGDVLGRPSPGGWGWAPGAAERREHILTTAVERGLPAQALDHWTAQKETAEAHCCPREAHCPLLLAEDVTGSQTPNAQGHAPPSHLGKGSAHDVRRCCDQMRVPACETPLPPQLSPGLFKVLLQVDVTMTCEDWVWDPGAALCTFQSAQD